MLVPAADSDSINVKIVDFGLAEQLSTSRTHLSDCCGTPLYVAPEVLAVQPAYGTSVDIWSAGVVLYTLLSGVYPFRGHCVKKIMISILQAAVTFDTGKNPEWALIDSDGSRNLVTLMLTRDPSQRPSAEELLSTHGWLACQLS
jgi:calcium-dependent protein kinase